MENGKAKNGQSSLVFLSLISTQIPVDARPKMRTHNVIDNVSLRTSKVIPFFEPTNFQESVHYFPVTILCQETEILNNNCLNVSKYF